MSHLKAVEGSSVVISLITKALSLSDVSATLHTIKRFDSSREANKGKVGCAST